MTIQLIGKDDSSFDDSEVLTGRWQSYIDSFVSVSRFKRLLWCLAEGMMYQSEATEGVSPSRVKLPYLRR